MPDLGSLIERAARRHPTLPDFIGKVMKDNLPMLASVVAWTLLTSIVPIVVGLLAITGILLQDPVVRNSVLEHLRAALQGVLTVQDLQNLLDATVSHRGVLAVTGAAGVIWGGSNVGGAIATVFQPVFQVRGRSWWQEKLIDIVMIFVFSALVIVIVGSTTAGALLDRLMARAPLSPETAFLLGTAISLAAAFLLFAMVYTVFPNVNPRFTLHNVWVGAITAAVLFEALTYVFPIYVHVTRFQRYGAILFAMLLLAAWAYFFALILLFGAEIVAFRALREARSAGRRLGPEPDGTVPQRMDV